MTQPTQDALRAAFNKLCVRISNEQHPQSVFEAMELERTRLEALIVQAPVTEGVI